MKRTLFAVATLAVIFAGAATYSAADESAQQAPAAAPPAAPAQDDEKATQGGCLADGGCCGQGACARAATSPQEAPGEDAGGDCPCRKAKKARKGT
jgi:hypothetical protein